MSATPGLVAAGFVMQAQADKAGPVIAKRLLNTRWYPYLEKAATGGDLAALFVGPIAAAVFVQVPPLRPVLAGVVESFIGDLTLQAPGPDGIPQTINLWQLIQQETAQSDQLAAEAAMREQSAGGSGIPDAPPADWNGTDPAEFVPPAEAPPEPPHASPYTDLRDSLGGDGFPEI